MFTNLRLVANFGEPEDFADWVTQVDEEQQQTLLAEREDVCVQAEPAEMREIGQFCNCC